MKRIIKLLIVAMTLCLLAGCANSEKDQVMKEYEEERARIEKQKEILDEEIAESERLLEENKPSTDDTIEESLKKKVEIARGMHVEVQKVSGNVDQVKAELGRLRAMELDKMISEIRALNKKLIQSRRDYDAQYNAPKSETLVVYFSYTGNTKAIAQIIAEETGADVFEITAKEPYTAADTEYDENTRAYKEQHDPKVRPEIDGRLPDMLGYKTVYLGYPIWHGEAPKIIYTFIESVKLDGKTIIPFCTSEASPVGSSAENLHDFAPKATWKDGIRFEPKATKEEVQDWLSKL